MTEAKVKLKNPQKYAAENTHSDGDRRCVCNVHYKNEVIKAVHFDKTNMAIRNYSCEQDVVTNLKTNAFLTYLNIDFASNTSALSISYSNYQTSLKASTVKVRIDQSPQVIARFYALNTNNQCNFVPVTTYLYPNISGIHDVHFEFFVHSSNPIDQAMDFLWFSFRNDLPNCPKPLTLD
ncbi:hypothetical protein CHUAL_012194 [Chamberlinius hualienensis]